MTTAIPRVCDETRKGETFSVDGRTWTIQHEITRAVGEVVQQFSIEGPRGAWAHLVLFRSGSWAIFNRTWKTRISDGVGSPIPTTVIR